MRTQKKNKVAGSPVGRGMNPFLLDGYYTGPMTVQQLVEIVTTGDEFPNGLDTVIKIGDIEGNNPTNGDITVTYHMPGDVVLSVDPNEGDPEYGAEIKSILEPDGGTR